MSDVRSVKNTTSTAPDEYVEQLRQKIGTEFTDRKSSGKKKNELGKDDFIKLMSAQLKHQDPINPMKNEQMAAQLAQFSALEQMVNVNSNLEKMTAGQKPQENMMAATMIGKRVQTDSSKFAFVKGQTPDMKFELPEDAEHTNVSVVDSKGEVIREFELGSVKKGPQSVKWDGKNTKGQDQNVGEYSFRVNAVDSKNKAIQVSTATAGLVNGIVFEQGKALLLVDGKKIPMEVVSQIEADSPKSNIDNAAKTMAGMKTVKGEKSEADDKALTNTKQKISTNNSSASTTNDEKNTELLENILQSAKQPEKLNTKVGANSPMGEIEGSEDDAYPLWNPSTNL